MSKNFKGNDALTTLSVLYDCYSASFYGEIKRNLYCQEDCDDILVDAFRKIWECLPAYDPEQEHAYTWAHKILLKEIRKKKVDLLLKEIFACRHQPAKAAVLVN